MNVRFHLVGALLALGTLAGCGAPGAPLPPSLELPRAVGDLTGSRKGDRVYLSWTVPTQTTDGQTVRPRKLGPAQVCRAVGQFPMTTCVQVVGQIPAASIPISKPGQQPSRMYFTDTLPETVEQQHPAEFATYTIVLTNWHGRSAGFSNQIRMPLAPTLPPPQSIHADVTADGIVLTFGCPGSEQQGNLTYQYTVFRHLEGSTAAVPVGTVSRDGQNCTITDRSFEWQKTYEYRVMPETTLLQNGKPVAVVQGNDSAELKVFANDIFPPAEPTGVQAVYSGVGQKPFVDLTWAPDTDADLAGYNVYRHEQGQAPTKINSELVKTPSFRDDDVVPGRTYYYSVSAVDVRGNESAKSEETSERVP